MLDQPSDHYTDWATRLTSFALTVNLFTLPGTYVCVLPEVFPMIPDNCSYL
jgi:hypothetical protein